MDIVGIIALCLTCYMAGVQYGKDHRNEKQPPFILTKWATISLTLFRLTVIGSTFSMFIIA